MNKIRLHTCSRLESAHSEVLFVLVREHILGDRCDQVRELRNCCVFKITTCVSKYEFILLNSLRVIDDEVYDWEHIIQLALLKHRLDVYARACKSSKLNSSCTCAMLKILNKRVH